MNCSDLHEKVSQYVDGALSEEETSLVDGHLAACPLCRQQADDFRFIKVGLRQLSRPAVPAARVASMRSAVGDAVRSKRRQTVSPAAHDWIQLRLIPLTVGLAVSLVIGISLLASMMSSARAIDQYAARRGADNSSVMLARGSAQRPLADGQISPVEFAHNRMAVAGDSPSINPQGTLAALSDTLNRNGIRDDEVVVVADVFSNGLARIAEVVEPSRNTRAIDELQRALDADLSDAPFVPASIDNRSGSVRVVLKFQSVQVNSEPKRKHH